MIFDRLVNIFDRLVNIFDRLVDVIGRTVAWLTLVMVVTTCVVVVLRYGLDMSAIMAQESVVYMHGLVFMLGLAFTLKHDGHVRVDLLYSQMTQRKRSIVNLLGHVVFLIPLSLTIFFTSLGYVANSWSVLEGSPEVGGIPAVFLLKTLVPVAAALLFLQAAVMSISEVRLLMKRG